MSQGLSFIKMISVLTVSASEGDARGVTTKMALTKVGPSFFMLSNNILAALLFTPHVLPDFSARLNSVSPCEIHGRRPHEKIPFSFPRSFVPIRFNVCSERGIVLVSELSPLHASLG